MTPPTGRTYGGVGGEQRVAERRARLLAAGLELLGTSDSTLSVRGVCKAAGLIPRYFYESFADVDELAVEVHRAVVDDLVEHVLKSLIEAPPDEELLERLRRGLTAVVDHLVEDPRRGHVVFIAGVTHPALSVRRPGVIQAFADVVRAQTEGPDDRPEFLLEASARFLVGGFGEVLTGWQNGTLQMTQEQMIDACVTLFGMHVQD